MPPSNEKSQQPVPSLLKDRQEKFIATATFFKKIDKENIIEDMGKKQEFIKNLSFDEFNILLLRINGLLQDTPIPERAFNAGENPLGIVRLINQDKETIYNPPLNADKMPLLQEAFEAFQRLESQNKIEDAAFMLGATINAIHPFKDGNGRTSRFVYTMVSSSKGNFNAADCNPESIQPFIESYISRNIYGLSTLEVPYIEETRILFPATMSDMSRLEFNDACKHDLDGIIEACRVYSKKNGEDFDKHFIVPNERILMKEFLFKNQKNISSIFDTYRKLKREYVEVLIDIFENADKYPIKTITEIFENIPISYQREYGEKTLKDLFLIDQKNRAVHKNEFSWEYLIKFFQAAQ